MAKLNLSFIENFSYLSPTAKEIFNIVDLSKVGIQDLSRLVSNDSDLLENLFKMVNSITYAFNRRLASVDEAIELVGVQTFRELVLLSSARKIYLNPELLYRSVFTAYCAKDISQRLGLKLNDSSEIYAVALLLDLGALFLDLKDPKYSSRIYQEESRLVRFSLEHEKYGLDSHSITMSLLEEFKLPSALKRIIFNQKPELNYSNFQLANSILDLAYRLSFMYQCDDSEIQDLLTIEHFQKFKLDQIEINSNILRKLYFDVQELTSI